MKDGGHSHSDYTRKISIGGEIDNNNDDCDSINFVTELQNIQSSISEYKKDDCLNVNLGPLEYILVEGEHGICGYITSLEAIKLISCLRNGKKFKAIILEIDNTFCRVRIRSLK